MAVSLGLAACGSARELPPPAEPATSPRPAATPAGRVLALGGGPEGLTVDPRSGIVAVGLRDPDRVALVDGRRGRVLRRVPIPASPRHLALAAPGGPVLVPAEHANVLVRVGLPDGDVRVTRVGRFPHHATAAGGRTFVANELGDSVSVVEKGRTIAELDTPVQPGGIAALGEQFVGLVAVRSNRLEVYDARALTSLGRAGAGAGPTHVVAGPPGRFYVADTRGNAVVVFRLRPRLETAGRINLPGAPYGMAIDRRRQRLWVTLTARNRVAELDLRGLGARFRGSFPTVRQPNTVAVDEVSGRVFVAGAAGGELQLIDPEEERRAARSGR